MFKYSYILRYGMQSSSHEFRVKFRLQQHRINIVRTDSKKLEKEDSVLEGDNQERVW
jgi:hypothetical protein